jgi:hypothetical protein
MSLPGFAFLRYPDGAALRHPPDRKCLIHR